MSGRRNVTMFGASAGEAGEALMVAAETLGRAFAERGWTLVNGGYGGTMLAGARGARAAGGRTIGVTCSIFKSPANEFISKIVPTADLYERLRAIIELGDRDPKADRI